MLLTGKQASEYVKLSEYSKITQAGIDLSVFKIEEVGDGYVTFLDKDKTNIPQSIYKEIPPEELDGKTFWILKPGVYSVTFNEGVELPLNCNAKITQRSSLYRTGNIIESPWFDAGYKCDNINTTMIINKNVCIEKNARLAQIVFHPLTENTEGYDGQWQNLSSATHK